MINDEGYSVTTSKHISELRGATSHYKQWHKTDCDLDLVYSRIKENESKLARARKPWIYTSEIESSFNALNTYLNEYEIVGVKSNPKYRKIKKIVKAIQGDLDGYKEVLLKAKKKEEAKAAKLAQAKLDDFFAYKCRTVRIRGNEHVRLSEDGTKIETTQGVKVRVEPALDLYRLIKLGKNVRGHRIDHYTVTSVNGKLKIGCHDINMDSVRKLGDQLLKDRS